VAWIAFITVLFMLPSSAVTEDGQLQPVAVLVVPGFAGIWWLRSSTSGFITTLNLTPCSEPAPG
jgi:hypothetical protein